MTSDPESKPRAEESGLELEPTHFPSDRYKPISEIGRGASGVVYLSKDKLLGIKVAVKCLRVLEAREIVSFQNEAQVASKLEHRNIVKVLNFGATEGGAPFMVMEFFDGVSLKQHLEKHGRLDPQQALAVFEQISESLEYAHSKGVYHRDLKSSNILWSDSNEKDVDVRIIDFGVALVKHLNQEPTIVQGRAVVGTPAYMPPDQAMGLSYDARSEIYALGCVMFEALTGRTPFAADTALETISLHVNAPVPTLSDVTGGAFSRDFEEIVSRSLAKKPDDRFQSMGEIRARLIELKHAEAGARRTKENQAEPSEQTSDVPPSLPHRRPRIAALFTVTMIGLATVIGIGVLISVFAKTVGDIFDGFHEPEVQTQKPVLLDVDEGISLTKWTQSRWGDNLMWWKRFSISDSDIAADLPRLKTLDYVSFWREDITSVGLSYLKDTKIKGLYLRGNPNIDRKAIAALSQMKDLEVLHIEENKQINDDDLEPLRGMSKLRILSLEDVSSTTDKTLEVVSSLKNLEVLYLGKMSFDGRGFKYLHALKRLRKLNLGVSYEVIPENFAELTALKSLEMLYLNETHLRDTEAEQIASALPLKVLDVARTKITDDGIDRLLQSKTLKILFVGLRKYGRYREASQEKLDGRIRRAQHAPFADEEV